mgnify:CR=1 FL=1
MEGPAPRSKKVVRRSRECSHGLNRLRRRSIVGLVKTVAVIGASTNRAKFGNKAVRAFAQQGFKVYPVNPRADEIEGIPSLASILDAPVEPDIVTVYLPPALVLKELPAIAEKGCGELWLNPGTVSPEVLAEAERLGLTVVQDCSLLRIGVSPAAF